MARNIMDIFCKIIMKYVHERIFPLAAGAFSSFIFYYIL
jgi:hypothetical protein